MSRQTGFTLLEVMVVLFIIAITASLAVVTLSNDDQSRVDQQARQLLEDFSYARDLALSRYALVGWQVSREGYRFALRDAQGQWQPHTSRALPERRWADGMTLQGIQDLPQQVSAATAPALVFFPAGEMTPLRATLQLAAAQRSIRVQAGRAELLDPADEK